MNYLKIDDRVFYDGEEYRVRDPHRNCNCGMILLYNDRHTGLWAHVSNLKPNKDYQDRFEHAMKYL